MKRGRLLRATKDENSYAIAGLVLLQAMVLKTSGLNSDARELELTLVKGSCTRKAE